MADEITLSIALDFIKGVRKTNTLGMGVTALEIDVAGTDFIGPKTQTIGTTAEAIDVGDIGTTGYFVVKNLDATNYVDFSRATFTSGGGTVRLKAGDAAVFRFASNTPYALADTAAVEIVYLMIEE